MNTYILKIKQQDPNYDWSSNLQSLCEQLDDGPKVYGVDVIVKAIPKEITDLIDENE